jgi:hypothetical protein
VDGRFHVQAVKESTTAFLILHDRSLSEVDLRTLTINPNEPKVISSSKKFLHCQVSRDGRFVGLVWGNTNPNKREVTVHIIGLSVSGDKPVTSRNLTLVKGYPVLRFSSDLSILCEGSHCYDLCVETHEMPMTPFTCPTGVISTAFLDDVLFCPHNRYLCLTFKSDFKVFEIRRSTKTLLEMPVRGIDFNGDSGKWLYKCGAFHPSLSFLLLVHFRFEDNGAASNGQVTEIDLLTLKKTKFPLPSTLYLHSWNL